MKIAIDYNESFELVTPDGQVISIMLGYQEPGYQQPELDIVFPSNSTVNNITPNGSEIANDVKQIIVPLQLFFQSKIYIGRSEAELAIEMCESSIELRDDVNYSLARTLNGDEYLIERETEEPILLNTSNTKWFNDNGDGVSDDYFLKIVKTF